MFINNRVWIAIFATIFLPLTLGGQQQQEKPCSNYLQGLYYGSWDKQEGNLAFVISPDGQPIPPKANDEDAPTKPGFYEGQRLFEFASSRFSSQGFTFRTIAIEGRTFSFNGRFGCEAVDVIPEVPYLEGELTEARNGRVVRRKKIHFGHAVIF
jgi:hypothetical protein